MIKRCRQLRKEDKKVEMALESLTEAEAEELALSKGIRRIIKV